MALAIEKKYLPLGGTYKGGDYESDLVWELLRREENFCRYNQYIADVEDYSDLQNFWQGIKAQEQAIITRLKEVVEQEIEIDDFVSVES